MNAPFRVALTADFRGPDGTPRYRDVGLSLFDGVTGITVNHFAEHSAEIQPDQLSGVNGVIVLTPKVTAQFNCRERSAGDRSIRSWLRQR